ncbi:MAG: hypothetical protein V1909_07065 [Candidatus Micrarchaeota archaeon]
MPFTLFHFGPALLILSLSLFLDPLALFLGSITVDFEGILGLFFGHDVFFQNCGSSCNLHGPLHSLLGGTIVAVLLAITIIIVSKRIPKKLRGSLLLKNEKIILASSFLGVYSHLFLDSFLYPEMNLAWPLGYWNPLFGAIGSFEIYSFCALAFVLGAGLMLVRKLKKNI